jgi:putative transposase
MVVCTATLPPKHKKKFERAYDYVKQMRKRGITKGQRVDLHRILTQDLHRKLTHPKGC